MYAYRGFVYTLQIGYQSVNVSCSRSYHAETYVHMPSVMQGHIIVPLLVYSELYRCFTAV